MADGLCMAVYAAVWQMVCGVTGVSRIAAACSEPTASAVGQAMASVRLHRCRAPHLCAASDAKLVWDYSRSLKVGFVGCKYLRMSAMRSGCVFLADSDGSS